MSDEPILAAIAALRADLMSRMDNLETGQAAFRTDLVAELGKARGAIMEKVAEVQTSITAIRDDIEVNFGAVEQACR